MIRTLFNIPLFYNTTKRIAEKKGFFIKNVIKYQEHYKAFSQLGIGDYVFTCSGYNKRIAKIIPTFSSKDYSGFERFHGQILLSIDLDFDDGSSCSFAHCIDKKLWSRDEIEFDWMNTFQHSIDSNFERDIHWHGSLEKAQPNIDNQMKRYNALKAGNHITNEFGEVLSEYKYIII